MASGDGDRQEAAEALERNEPRQALAIAQRELEDGGWDTGTALTAALALYQLDDLVRAERVLRRVVSHDPANAGAMHYLGRCVERQGRREEGRSLVRAAEALQSPETPAMRPESARSVHAPASGPGEGDRETRSLAAEVDDHTATDWPATTAGELLYAGRPRLRAYPGRFLSVAVLAAIAVESFRISELGIEGWSGPLRGVALLFAAIAVYKLVSLLLRWRGSSYEIYERRIDLRVAGFYTHYDSIWLYEIKDVRLEVPPLLALSGTGRIHIRTATIPAKRQESANERVHIIPSLGNRKFMKWLWQELRDASLVERRAMHRWWV